MSNNTIKAGKTCFHGLTYKRNLIIGLRQVAHSGLSVSIKHFTCLSEIPALTPPPSASLPVTLYFL